MVTTLVKSERIGPDIYSFYFKRPEGFRYIAGQFIELTLKHPDNDSRGEKRWFTLSSSPSEKLLCITTKITDNSSTFKNYLRALKNHSNVTISDAMGDFVLPKDSTIPLVFIAGGIGITPYRSMIKSLIDTKQQRHIHLLYAAQSKKQIVFQDIINQSFLDVDYSTNGSRISPTQLQNVIDSIKSPYIYISGPEQMATAIKDILLDLHISKTHIITDYFPGYDTA